MCTYVYIQFVRISVTDDIKINEQDKSIGIGLFSTYKPNLKRFDYSCRKLWPGGLSNVAILVLHGTEQVQYTMKNVFYHREMV